jgi:3-keto-5-aminohexanoate cleavage enzyme
MPRSAVHVPHPLRPYDPLIVNVALTGMVPRRPSVPHVPVTARQIVQDAVDCTRAGATILHLHARDADQSPDWHRAAYERFIPELRESCPGAILCVTTSGRDVKDFERRADVLELEGDAKPDMASLTLGSMNFRTQASVNDPQMILGLVERMRERSIRPELEVFDTGMAYLAAEFLDRGIIEGPVYANILLGGPNTAPATAGSLVHLVDILPTQTVWAAGGLGPFQFPMNGLAVLMGGHVRTGLEDSPWMDLDRAQPATNARLVQRVTEIARLAGRSLADAGWVRARLGLDGGGSGDGDRLTAASSARAAAQELGSSPI